MSDSSVDRPHNAPPLLASVPDQPEKESDVYGVVDFFDGIKTRKFTIGVYFGAGGKHYDEDILIDNRSTKIVRHPFDSPGREATEEERAAVGWTW